MVSSPWNSDRFRSHLTGVHSSFAPSSTEHGGPDPTTVVLVTDIRGQHSDIHLLQSVGSRSVWSKTRNVRRRQTRCTCSQVREDLLSRVVPQPVMVQPLKTGRGLIQMLMGLTDVLKTRGSCSFSKATSLSLVRLL